MSILSIQSHVAYGYVGNKAATFPLQSMGYDVWPVNAVQFSNHTGYGKWQGEIFPGEHIKSIIQGLEDIGVAGKCQAILSGYMGSAEICSVVKETVKKFKAQSSGVLYLCDPVIGGSHCFVKPEVLDFFQTKLAADIITPNQFEAETLSNIKISDLQSLREAANYFHNNGIKVVVITGIKLAAAADDLYVFVSDESKQAIIKTKEYKFPIQVNGTGDLFSAVFLGSYLKHKNAQIALQHAVYYMEKVLHSTLLANERELQVLTEKYDIVSAANMPEITLI